MSDSFSAEKISASTTNENSLEDKDNVVSLKTAKLIKMRQKLKKLKQEVLEDYTKDLKECKSACTEISSIIENLIPNSNKNSQ